MFFESKGADSSVGLFPLWEGRHAMASTLNAIYRDITGKRRTPVIAAEGVETPPEEDIKGKEKVAQT